MIFSFESYTLERKYTSDTYQSTVMMSVIYQKMILHNKKQNVVFILMSAGMSVQLDKKEAPTKAGEEKNKKKLVLTQVCKEKD